MGESKDHGACGSFFPLRVAGETYTGFPLHVSLPQEPHERGGFGLRQGSGPPRCPASHDSNLTMS